MMTPNVFERPADAPTQDRTVLLEVKHLNVDYETGGKPVHAVNDVSFTLHHGQILGLAGESGSGKSTLAYAITRLLQPPAIVTGGEILYYPREETPARSREQRESRATARVPAPPPYRPRPYNDDENGLEDNVHSKGGGGVDEGRGPLRSPSLPTGVGEKGAIDILQLSRKRLRSFRWSELAIVFQSAMNALNPVMRLEVQITDVLRAHTPSLGADACHQRALELLRLVGITADRLRSYPHELSGGMRQRAIIAIALALNPEIIIMDEPTTALDVVVQRDILVELMALRERLSFAVIFITHDLSLLLEIADQVAIMYAGRMVEIASWQELYRHPRHPYTYGLLNSFPTLHGPKRRMSGILGSPPDLRGVPSGCAFHPRCSFAFDACSERVPALATPQVEGMHIGAQGLEPDGELANGVSWARSQKCMTACHLYNAQYLKTRSIVASLNSLPEAPAREEQ